MLLRSRESSDASRETTGKKKQFFGPLLHHVYVAIFIRSDAYPLNKRRADRKKLHPVIRMEDVLNMARCDTISNVVGNMMDRMTRMKTTSSTLFSLPQTIWYNIPVALSKEKHLQTEEHWQGLLHRLKTQIALCMMGEGGDNNNNGKDLYMHVDLFPASKKFVVYQVLKEDAGNKKLDELNNRHYDENNPMDMGKQKVDPIYHMYLECRNTEKRQVENEQEIAGRNMEFMDIMYNRWAIQNSALLRKRILERKAGELMLVSEKNDDPIMIGSDNVQRRGLATSRAIALSRVLNGSVIDNNRSKKMQRFGQV